MSFKPVKGYKIKSENEDKYVENSKIYFNTSNITDIYLMNEEHLYTIYFGSEDNIRVYSPQLTKILEKYTQEDL